MPPDELVLVCPVCGKIERGRPGQKHGGLKGHPLGGETMREATPEELAAVNAEWAARQAAERMQAVTPGGK
jgi:hypothetical protein